MTYHSRKLHLPFADVMDKLTENLKQQGFGIVTSIDVKDIFKQKLNVDFRNYRILGACNPQFAYKAISLESHLGIMMPCNVVIQQHENGEVEVSAVNPLESLDKNIRTPLLSELALEVSNRLRAAVDDLHRSAPEQHAEALPCEK
ncbi:DUF302 domain-containing protein [Chryseolinea lacunae]|uniref:DUF302 domain-containing protein n=1 Tax=Chryseolinea lacunae TaxID=2801331 RepID=A0ABS1KNX9_9BACT|nr:DUF302 domain-containing protein [Chryseolinea lacunae]MBL0741049.1 DUF302 domain-containing protein [Chryseolinea lacunae]